MFFPVRAAWPLFLAVLLLGSTAGAASPARERALELFEKSARAYKEGRFQDAIDLLVEARRVKQEPVLLYNLGRAYEAMGRLRDAADAYEQYLKEVPRATDRGALEGRIVTLRSQAEQLEKVQAPPEAAPPPPDPPVVRQEAQLARPADARPSVVPIVLVGVGLAGVATGVTLGILATRGHDAAVNDPVQSSAQDKQDEAGSLATGATIAFVAGGAVAGAGLVWLGVRALTPSPRVSLLPGVLPGAGSLTLRGTF